MTMVFGVMTALLIAALTGAHLILALRMKTLAADYAALETKFNALREQNQQELLAIGQRVLEADKVVRRFSERLDAIETVHPAGPAQYGQLQNLLMQASEIPSEESAAEAELMSLLRRQQRG